MEEINAKEAKRLVDEEGARLIDVREQYEWDEIRVPGARLIPLGQYEADPAALPAEGITIFICAHGNRSQVAGLIYEQAYAGETGYSMKGGIEMWAARAFPVEIGPNGA